MTHATVELDELKAHLAEVLRRAGAGERIIVCDGGRPVAEIAPPGGGLDVRWATHPPSELLALRGVPAPFPVDSSKLLRQDRDAR